MSKVLPGNSHRTGELLGGRYTLADRIGEGGMAVVYRARDERLGRTVAVKIFRGAAGASEEMARNESETRLLASLNHHSLVTLFDAHLDSDGDAYLVMEYIDGPTLRSRIAQGSVEQSLVAAMARDLAEALHVVHQAGVVHRDIKPSNVLLRPPHMQGGDYLATLADFGIAYLIDSTRITTPGALIGTAAYLSPEQVLGAPPAPASDIYSLGMVLVEALTGKRAFPQNVAAEVALARLTTSPEIPTEFGFGWTSLLSAMTARNADERPTALEVLLLARQLDEPNNTLDETAPLTAPTKKLNAPIVGLRLDREDMPPIPAEAQSGSGRYGGNVGATVVGTERITRPLDYPPADVHSARPKRAQMRWHPVAAIGAVLLTGIAISVAIWATGLASAPDPEPAPTIPTLTEPLESDMKHLLELVTP